MLTLGWVWTLNQLAGLDPDPYEVLGVSFMLILGGWFALLGDLYCFGLLTGIWAF